MRPLPIRRPGWTGLPLVALVVLLVSACTTGGLVGSTAAGPPTGTATPAAVGPAVEIKLFTFKPSPLTVPAGATVVWTNNDPTEHTVSAGSEQAPGNAFDSGPFGQGQTFRFTFQAPGTYTYFCKKHTSMQGEIVVTPR